MNQARERGRRAAALGQAQDVLARAFRETREGMLLVSLAAPVTSAASVWAAGDDDAVAHCPANGPMLVGLSTAAELRSSTMNARAALAWTRRLLRRLPRRVDLTPFRIFAGAGFSRASVGRGIWKRFPALRLVAPRWTYSSDGEQGSLALLADRTEDVRVLNRELERLWAAAETAPPTETAHAAVAIEQQSPKRWAATVDEALRIIQAKQLQKVVLARSAKVSSQSPWDSATVLHRLTRSPGCTAFAVREGDASFLGATPERLVAREGRRVLVEALAGTAAPEDEAVALRHPKNVLEHNVVVEEIIRRLRPVSAVVRRGPRLTTRRLQDMVHLLTPIEARLRGDTHVLDLALRLHPTPAVGGLPRERAVRFIESHEAAARGWYGGFVGWFDAGGQGEFSVAIRSGLLRGNRAHVFTGAGVVAGSTAAGEYEETALKQRPFLRALGVIS